MWEESFSRIVEVVMRGEVPRLVDINSISEKGMMLLCEVIRSRRLREELELARKQVVVKKLGKKRGRVGRPEKAVVPMFKRDE